MTATMTEMNLIDYGFEELSNEELEIVVGGYTLADILAATLGSFAFGVTALDYAANKGWLQPTNPLVQLARNSNVQAAAMYAGAVATIHGFSVF
jgi:hypothetical protein